MAAQLVKDWKPSGTNVTGLSHMLDPVKQVEVIKRVPEAKRVGRGRIRAKPIPCRP
jgi:putative ABC transport system substrate-binding protein